MVSLVMGTLENIFGYEAMEALATEEAEHLLESNPEFVSKVILRHAHPSATQRYLWKITDLEAGRWIEK